MEVLIVFTAEFLSLLISFCLVYLLLRPIVRGAVYFPTSKRNVETIMRFAAVKPGEKAADLGSGDGRIVIALAKAGAEAHGYEINPLLVLQSRMAIKKAGMQKRAFVHWRSFWKENFDSYNVVTLYGIPYIMKQLERKLKRELPRGTRVVSNIFRFPEWTPKQSENGVHLYIKG